MRSQGERCVSAAVRLQNDTGGYFEQQRADEVSGQLLPVILTCNTVRDKLTATYVVSPTFLHFIPHPGIAMFRSIWFWAVLIIGSLALWLGRDQISAYVDKLPMTTQQRTTDTKKLATLTPRATNRTVTVAQTAFTTATPAAVATGAVRAASLPTAQSVSRYTTYVVKKGDTLYSIARRYQTNVDVLQRINAISDPSTLYAGQEIKVPKAQQAITPVPKPGTKPYVVRKGDTLSGIARRFNTSVVALQKLNHFSNPNQLVVGSTILVPGATTSPTKAVSVSRTPQVTPGVVRALPVTGVPSSSRPATSAPVATPVPTATPTPIPTMPSVCSGAQEAAFVWGVSFCLPPGWALSSYDTPHRTAVLTRDEASGDRSLMAISRLDGSPNAPLSWSMRQARSDFSSEIAATTLIPGRLATPEQWELPVAVQVAGVEGQASDAQTTYLKTGHAAHVRIIVFNHDGRRWRIVMVAPEALWEQYKMAVFSSILRTLEVF